MGKLKLQHKAKQMTRRFIERMFYFTPTFSSSVKVIYLKVSWQSVFSTIQEWGSKTMHPTLTMASVLINSCASANELVFRTPIPRISPLVANESSKGPLRTSLPYSGKVLANVFPGLEIIVDHTLSFAIDLTKTIRNNIWECYSSQTYVHTPGAGKIHAWQIYF
jgi:hypothetical protein